ncbi:MAG: hypothetical protein ACFFDI_27470 [Promethearchaeota archaeon]
MDFPSLPGRDAASLILREEPSGQPSLGRGQRTTYRVVNSVPAPFVWGRVQCTATAMYHMTLSYEHI